MIHRKRLQAALCAATFLVSPGVALADPRDDRIKALEQKLEALGAEIKALRAEQAAEKPAQAAPAPQPRATVQASAAAPPAGGAGAAILNVANGRPTFSTADGATTLSIRTLLQYDMSYFMQSGRSASGTDLVSGTNFRRARIGLDGKLFGDWFYSFLYDMGSTGTEVAKLADAYIQYDGFAPFHIRTGSFVSPQGIEDQTGSGDLMFLERAATTDLARGLTGGDGRKNYLNIFAQGTDYYASLTWSGGKNADPLTFDQQQALVARLSGRIYKDRDTNVIVSANGSRVFKIADTAASPAGPSAITFQNSPENTVDGTRLISTGAINARRAHIFGLESAANHRNFYVQGGYYGYGITRRASMLSNPHFDGWYVQGSWVMTGESRPYVAATSTFGSPRAAHPFNFNGEGLGAWELTARYSVLDLDYKAGIAGLAASPDAVRGGRQDGLTVGINWYPISMVRFLFDYQHLNIDHIAPTAPFAQIGQKVDIATARAQLAF